MNRLDRIQRISGVVRYLLLLVGLVLAAVLALSLLDPSQELITLGDDRLNELRTSGLIAPGLMLAGVAPAIILLALGIYWLQRLFGEYHQGHFFTDGTMRCYVWLVWLKLAAFISGILIPVVLASLSSAVESTDLDITIDAGTLVELLVLLLIVHLLKAAQQINDENKAFV